MYRCIPESKVPIASGVSYGWTGLYDGLVPGYIDEQCGSAPPLQPNYRVNIDVGAWIDPVMTRAVGVVVPAGGTFRYPELDRFSGASTDVVEAWADLEIVNAAHQITIRTLAVVNNPPPGGSTGITELTGDRSWIISNTQVDTDTFDVSVALIGYYSNGDGTYREIFVHPQAATADASSGSVKINLAGAVKAYLDTCNEASFYRWIILPPGDSGIDIENGTTCESLRQVWEASRCGSGLTGSSDTLVDGTTPFYIWTGEARDYLWTYDNLSLSTIRVGTDGGEIIQTNLVQTQYIQAALAPNN